MEVHLRIYQQAVEQAVHLVDSFHVITYSIVIYKEAELDCRPASLDLLVSHLLHSGKKIGATLFKALHSCKASGQSKKLIFFVVSGDEKF